MAVASITPEQVRKALRAVSYAQPPREGELRDLDVITIGLRHAGLADTAASRSWLLGRCLEKLVAREREHARARIGACTTSRSQSPGPISVAASTPTGDGSSSSPDAAGALEQLAADFRNGDFELEAWALLYYRYFAPSRPTLCVVASELGVTYRTLARRLERGHRQLADVLLEEELMASRFLAVRPGAAPHDRVTVRGAVAPSERIQPDRPLDAVAKSLLQAATSDDVVASLSLREAVALANLQVADLTEYRLGRVAEWSQCRYRLDERFVSLAMQLERTRAGVGADGGHSETERFTNLGDVLAAIPEPALVVLGPPGSGKSTLLRHHELQLALDGLRGATDAVTFLVSLDGHGDSDQADDPPCPMEWLAAAWERRQPRLPPLEALLEEERLVLLLDGLNELPHSNAAHWRARVAEWRRFLRENLAPRPGNRCVFTCRGLDYSASLSSPTMTVRQARLEPLDDRTVQAILATYLPAQATRLWEAFAGTPQLDLLRVPFFVRIVADQVAETGSVGQGRAGLITGFVRAALSRELGRDNPLFADDTLLDAHDRVRITQARRWRSATELPERGILIPRLTRLACAMQSRVHTRVPSPTRIDYGSAEIMLDHQLAQTIMGAGVALGVLDCDLDRDEITFVHQLVQEYFAARRIALDGGADVAGTPWRRDDVDPNTAELISSMAADEPLPPSQSTGWEETVLLATEMTSRIDEFLIELADTNLPLAGRAAAISGVAERLSSSSLKTLRTRLSDRMRDVQADLRARIAAASALGPLGHPGLEEGYGPEGPFLLPRFVDLKGGAYCVGEDRAGSTADDNGVRGDSAPRHFNVYIPPLAMAVFPVTNAEWARFIEAGGYDNPRWWDTPAAVAWQQGRGTAHGTREGVRHWWRRYLDDPALLWSMRSRGELTAEAWDRWQERLTMSPEEFEAHLHELYPDHRVTEPRLWRDERYNQPLQPVVGVCWYEARAYCNWLAAGVGEPIRLPTEVEWEAAARGREARTYPWGDDFQPLRANTVTAHVRRPSPVGVFVEGDTPTGLSDMSGNVNEWTSTLWSTELLGEVCDHAHRPSDCHESAVAGPEARRVLRGGSWSDLDTCARATWRVAGRPDGWDYTDGLRLVIAPR